MEGLKSPSPLCLESNKEARYWKAVERSLRFTWKCKSETLLLFGRGDFFKIKPHI